MVLFFEVLGVLLMALAWMVAIARMIETRQWSPVRPAVMVVVMTGCLLLMAQTLLDYAVDGELRSTFYLAAWNLGMALFDCKIALILARRGEFVMMRRQSAGDLVRRVEAETAFDGGSVVIPPVGSAGAPVTGIAAAARPASGLLAPAAGGGRPEAA